MKATRITAKAAAELLGVSLNKLYVWAKEGVIPAKRVGRSWIFVRENLEEWLRSTED